VLTPDQTIIYERMRQIAMAELEVLDRDIAAELSRTKKRLLELQDQKRAVKQILDGASARLGLNGAAPLKELNSANLEHATAAAADAQASGTIVASIAS
jgi:hypothetical protein